MSRGVVFALAAHGLLILALTLGVRWRTSTPEVVSAELWSATPQQAAPPPPARIEPPPPPPPPQPPQPVVRPAPPPPPAQADTREADIALERQREAARRAEDERRERDKREKRELDARKEKERQEAERRDQEKKELQARKEADDKKKREAVEAKRREQEDQQRLVLQRDEQLKRMHQQMGAGSETSTGTAARDSAPSTEYAGRIRARIKPNIVFAEDAPGNPKAVVIVGVAPTGKIISRRLEKSSGNKAWDDAVLRAIDRTDMLPRDIDGRIPSSMELAFRPDE